MRRGASGCRGRTGWAHAARVRPPLATSDVTSSDMVTTRVYRSRARGALRETLTDVGATPPLGATNVSGRVSTVVAKDVEAKGSSQVRSMRGGSARPAVARCVTRCL